MKASLLLAWALILQTPTEAAAEPHYVVTLPAVLEHSRDQKVCLQLTSVTEALHVTVTLRTETQNRTLIEKTIEDPVLFDCVTFKIPAPASGDEEVASVQVVGKGSVFSFEKSKKVLIKTSRPQTLVQTDKPIYKPGETVKFRITTLDDSFTVSKEVYSLVELLDPEENRVGQWLDVKPKKGIVDLSFPLANEPPLGSYSIKTPNMYWPHRFSVQEYVLPKFEVTIEAPASVSAMTGKFTIKICGRYTYGKPVIGMLDISVCRGAMNRMTMYGSPSVETACQKYIEETYRDGCYNQRINTNHFNMTVAADSFAFKIKAQLKENATGLSASQSALVSVATEMVHVKFEDVESYYQMGLPFNGKLKVVDRFDKPVVSTTVYLIVNVHDKDSTVPLITDDSGVAHFSLDTSTWNNTLVSITGKGTLASTEDKSKLEFVSFFQAFRWLKPFYSESKSFLQIHAPAGPLDCYQDHQFTVNYLIHGAKLDTDTQFLDFFYLVIGRNEISLSGQKRIEIGSTNPLQGDFQLQLPVTSDLTPKATLIIYTIFSDGAVTADNVKFTVSKCFRNKVKVEFAAKKVRPGSDVTMHVEASPGSLCSVRAVDKSVQILSSSLEYGITASEVFENVHAAELSPRGFPYRIEDFEPYPCLEVEEAQIPDPDVPEEESYTEEPPKLTETEDSPDSQEFQNTRKKRSLKWAPWYQSQADVYGFFKESGLKILTNARVKKPVSCVHTRYIKFSQRIVGGFSVPDETPALESAETPVQKKPKEKASKTRSYFPETWLYDLVPVGDEGKTDVLLTAPDTITKWNADAFCVADIGLGIAPTTSLEVFKPFFVDMLLPYSIVRGEELPVKATVFNYLQQCLEVSITLLQSRDFKNVVAVEQSFGYCLCADESKTFTWNIVATTLGKVNLTISTTAVKKSSCNSERSEPVDGRRADTVVKSLLVEAEGVKEDKTHNFLLCAKDDNPGVEEILLELPERLVEGSARAFINVVGDLMGSVVQNMGKLLQMPFGCGEQNMVNFAPNIFVLQYLSSTGMLTPELEKKAKGLMESGYQRQLLYKHDDGSYSAFGKSDEKGNTWLTAFVMRCFSQARHYIFIDEKIIEDSVKWLEQYQRPDGSFESVGKLFNNELKGAVDDVLSITAYTTAALLEAGQPKNSNMVKNSLMYLQNYNKTHDSVYSQALLLYVSTLAEEAELRQEVLKKLEANAVRKGGMLYWGSPNSRAVTNYWTVSSAAIQISAFVILGLTSAAEVTKGEKEMASQIVSWLAKQQSPYGGFRSTQDTVVGLQALARYSALTYSKRGGITLTIKSPQRSQQELHVEELNRLVLQRAPLMDLPGKYTVTAKGSGCVYVQTTLKYNTPPVKSNQTFSLQVETEPKECTEFDIRINVSYLGNRASTNMALIEVKMLSGFIPVKESVKKLEKSVMVKRTEVTVNMVNIYLDELTHELQSYLFSVEQEIAIQHLKPATVKVSDYYKPEEQAVTDYSAPCSSDESKDQQS